MLNIFTVAFFGHRQIHNMMIIDKLLEEEISKLIREKEYVDFLVGRNGEFDKYAASVVLRSRKNTETITVHLFWYCHTLLLNLLKIKTILTIITAR